MSNSTNNELEHVGVLGMRWGVRKAEEPHSDHLRAKRNANPYRDNTGRKQNRDALYRLADEKKIDLLRKNNLISTKKSSKEMSDDEIKNYLSDKVLSKKAKTLVIKDKASREAKVVGAFVAVYGAVGIYAAAKDPALRNMFKYQAKQKLIDVLLMVRKMRIDQFNRAAAKAAAKAARGRRLMPG